MNEDDALYETLYEEALCVMRESAIRNPALVNVVIHRGATLGGWYTRPPTDRYTFTVTFSDDDDGEQESARQ